MGDGERARTLGEQALLEFRTGGTNTVGHACLAYLGVFLSNSGDWKSAAAYLAEARTLYMSIDADAMRMEAQSLEACCMLALGRPDEALHLATEAWMHMRERGTEGMDFPSRAYICVADVFAAVETPPVSAHAVVQSGYQDLMNRAEKISDPTWRRSFLENGVENKELIERWRIMNKGAALN